MIKKRYWDSAVFLAWFNEEEKNYQKCQGVIKLAEDGDLVIITSALTLVEVIKLKNHPSLASSDEIKIRRFFEQEFISVRPLDRVIAEEARQLIWKHHVMPKDSVHLATALKMKLDTFDTFDGDLKKLSGKLGRPLMRIGEPDIPYQEVLFDDKKENKEDKQ